MANKCASLNWKVCDACLWMDSNYEITHVTDSSSKLLCCFRGHLLLEPWRGRERDDVEENERRKVEEGTK